MLLDPPPPGSAAVGTGRLTLDVIVQEGSPPRAQAGGTCGNVLVILAYLGWPAWALGRIGDDDPGRRFVRDLERWGVGCSLLERTGPTPVVVHHVREADHSFTGTCPACGAALPEFEPPVWLPLHRLPPASVFFFDQDSPAALHAARLYRRDGALVMWEPNYTGPEVDVEGAMAASDVVKYSAATVSGPRGAIERLTVIETQGERGVAFARAECCGFLPAYRVAATRDAAGCGDWMTAGYLHARAHLASVEDALRIGTALAAWNAAFVGARGGMYAVDRATFREQVTAILAGAVIDPGKGREPQFDDAGAYCPACAREVEDSASRRGPPACPGP